MTKRFDQTTVIITGASLGVGAATALLFADLGANLVLIARGRKNLEKLEAELAIPERCMIVAMDVTDTDQFAQVLQQANDRFGSIDILVNNAGYHQRGPAETIDIDDLGKMVDVNLKAPIVMSRMVLPYLRKSNTPAIINVASLAGRTPVPGSATYSATKFGLRAFGFALAEELRGSGIKIASVSPGPIDTGFIMDDIDSVTDLTFSQPISTAEEVAQVIADLVHNKTLDQPMPKISGLLTTVSYLFPSVGRKLRPMLEKKGRRTKEKLKKARG